MAVFRGRVPLDVGAFALAFNSIFGVGSVWASVLTLQILGRIIMAFERENTPHWHTYISSQSQAKGQLEMTGIGQWEAVPFQFEFEGKATFDSVEGQTHFSMCLLRILIWFFDFGLADHLKLL